MKKLLAIVMIAGSLITSVFAQEKTTLNNLSLSFPIRMASGTAKCIGVDWHGYSFSNNTFGLCTQASFWLPLDALKDNTYGAFAWGLDGSIGPSFRVLDTGLLALVVSVGGTLNFFDAMDVIFELDLGAFADVCFGFKLSDDLYISAGIQYNYYFLTYYMVGSSSGSSDKSIQTFAPRIGITYKE